MSTMAAGESSGSRAEMVAATAVVRSYCDAWLDGDTMGVLALYHQDLTLYWPGQHRFAGVHEGQEAAIVALLGLQAVTNRVPVRILDVLCGESSIMIKVLERWSSGETGADQDAERSIELVRVLEYTVQDDQLRTCRVYESDQPAIDVWLTLAHT